MSAIIKLQAISKTYRNGELTVDVLHDIDLTIERGEQVVIMGRSGAGKSTLMNIIGCLDRPSAGRYRLADQAVESLDDDALSRVRGETIGFVFQSFHLLRSLSVVDNVALPMTYQRVHRAQRRARAEELLRQVGLGHRFDHRPHQLSGGERQRVAIARALSNAPSVLLADEPTGNLDTRARERILALFDELHQQLGLTIVVVTHDPDIGASARRRVELRDGQIACC